MWAVGTVDVGTEDVTEGWGVGVVPPPNFQNPMAPIPIRRNRATAMYLPFPPELGTP
jgi:hypothetical protein